ncbi:nuclear transport factor 2 family protein [Enterobacteriaceae bacterium C34A]
MSTYHDDRLQITDLMTGWIHRDLAEWDKMHALFHEGATIEITWFEGLASEFVDASARMGESALKTKHMIGNPTITFNGEKALVETNAMIIGENIELNVGCCTHNRFFDRVEKRNGHWKIVHRQSVYDMGSFTFPVGLVEIDMHVAQKYPREYAALAYVLEKSGFPVNRVFATRGSELEKKMKAEGEAWLKA